MHGKLKSRRFPYTRAFAFVVLFGNRTFRHFVFTHKVNRCAMRTTKTEILEVLWPLSLPGKRIGRNSEKALLKRQRSVDGDYFPFVTSWSCQKLLKENFSEILKLFCQQRWVPVFQRTKQLVCLLWRVIKENIRHSHCIFWEIFAAIVQGQSHAKKKVSTNTFLSNLFGLSCEYAEPIGNLFEPRMATGSEVFSYSTCLHTACHGMRNLFFRFPSVTQKRRLLDN